MKPNGYANGNGTTAAAPTGALADLIEFAKFLDTFRSIQREIWYGDLVGKERNGEHCFQLAMFAWYANIRLNLRYDDRKLILYALVHDLVETYANDTPAFAPPQGDLFDRLRPVVNHDNKKDREAKSLKRIQREWGAKFPEMLAHMRMYERRGTPESSFVYALDKFLSEVNIFNDNGRTWKRLDVTLEAEEAYKTPRIAAHPAVLQLWNQLLECLRQRPDLITSAARRRALELIVSNELPLAHRELAAG